MGHFNLVVCNRFERISSDVSLLATGRLKKKNLNREVYCIGSS